MGAGAAGAQDPATQVCERVMAEAGEVRRDLRYTAGRGCAVGGTRPGARTWFASFGVDACSRSRGARTARGLEPAGRWRGGLEQSHL